MILIYEFLFFFHLEVNILVNISYLLPDDHIVFYSRLEMNLSLTGFSDEWPVKRIIVASQR